MKKLIPFILMGTILFSCSTPEGSSSSRSIPSYSFSSRPSEGVAPIPMYVSTYGEHGEITYHPIVDLDAYILPQLGEDRVYLSLDDYLIKRYLQNSYYYPSENPRRTLSDGVYRYDFRIFDFDTGEFKDRDYLEIDVNKNTITISSLYGLALKGAADHPLNMAAVPGESSTHTLAQEPYSEANNPFTFDYGSYGFEEIIANDEIFLPPLIISTAVSFGRPIVYNGYGFFEVNDAQTLLNIDDYTDFYWYGSHLHEKGQKSEAVARYDANCLLFTLDHVYGGKDIRSEIKNTKYGDYLKNSHPEIYANLYSTDPTKAMNAYDWIMLKDIGDGHTSPLQAGTFYSPGERQITGEYSQRVISMQEVYNSLMKKRQEAFGSEEPTPLLDKYLQIKEETAIIRFDEFIPGAVPAGESSETYESHIADDNFSLFYTAFRRIRDNGNVKKVVFDLSLNGGGAVMALMDVIGFVAEASTIETYEASTQSYFQAKFLTDCNADGKYEEGESPANEFAMYVLTSGYTFSCANIFTYYAKKGGAKIIGKQSGGGAYSPMSTILPDGYGCYLSSDLEYGRTPMGGESIDEGVPVDINLEYDDFYSIDAIRRAIA